MRIGIIDVGSNTIRLNVYDCVDGEAELLLGERAAAALLGYVRAGVLSPAGIRTLCDVLDRFRRLAELLQVVELHCFATASLRHLVNQREALDAARARGVAIRVLTGEEEARYDLAGLLRAVDAERGAGLDLGGGSCQIFAFRDRQMTTSVSLPIGTLVLHDRFVRDVLPTREEAAAIRSFVREQLAGCEKLAGCGEDGLWAMGGSARAAARLFLALDGKRGPVSGCRLERRDLKRLCRILVGGEAGHLPERLLPDRMNTIVPGLLVLREICRHTGAERLTVVKNGVREGYLWETALKNRGDCPDEPSSIEN